MREIKLRSKGETRGFTIIELSFSLAFIAVLSIIVVLVITNAVSAYHRGLTLNQLNTAGMDVVDDMRRAVQGTRAQAAKKDCATAYKASASVLTNCESDNGMGFVVKERRTTVKVGNALIEDAPVYGAFCTGAYSYLWNSGYFFSEEYDIENLSAVKLIYKTVDTTNSSTVDNFRLLKIPDEERRVCKVAAGYSETNSNGGEYYGSDNYSTMPGTIDISGKGIEGEPVDILTGSKNLALYDLVTSLPAEGGGSNNVFYYVSFVLGTVQGGINVRAQGNYCTAPEDYDNAGVENFDYCAINKFNFAAQATGG